MMTHYKFCAIFFLFVLVLFLSTCRRYLSPDFRQIYQDYNAIIHSDTSQLAFLKVHMKNGEVAVLTNWTVDEELERISGQGKLYDFNRNVLMDSTFSLPLEEIALMETNQMDMIQSRDGGRIAGMIILTGVNVGLLIYCVSNPKACFGSCPTFYVDENAPLQAVNAEGFSSSIAPALEKRDLDALQYSTSDTHFSLSMRNEALETHVVNQLVLHAVPKKKDEHVFHDKAGNFYRCAKRLMAPLPTPGLRPEVYEAVCSRGGLEYFSVTDSFDLAAQEEHVFEFEVPAGKDRLGLLLNFRQSLVTTFLLYSGLSYMGDEAADFLAKAETNQKIRKALGSPFDRMGPIQLFYWNEQKHKWILFEALHETGPIATNTVLAPLPPHPLVPGQTIKNKVNMTKGFWRLNYLALASIQSPVSSRIVLPHSLAIRAGGNVALEEVLQDDDQYLISLPGDHYRFSFRLPELGPEDEHELFLASKGYYLEWIRREWMKGKDIPKLKKILLGNKNAWKALAVEYKEMEHEMEEVFWNSAIREMQ